MLVERYCKRTLQRTFALTISVAARPSFEDSGSVAFLGRTIPYPSSGGASRSAWEEGRHVTLRVQRQKKLILVALVFGLSVIAPGPSWGRGQETPDAAAEAVDYRIGPGDVLELVVWKET